MQKNQEQACDVAARLAALLALASEEARRAKLHVASYLIEMAIVQLRRDATGKPARRP